MKFSFRNKELISSLACLLTFGVVFPADAANGWFAERVEGTGISPSVGVDSSRKVHIVYYDLSSLFMYVTGRLGNWQSPERVDETNLSTSVSLAIDPIDLSNRVHVCYIKQTSSSNRELWYATKTKTEGVWQREKIANIGPLGLYCDIAIDRDSNVHIVYSNKIGNYSAINYVSRKNSIWGEPEVIDSPDVDEMSIAVDKNFNPGIHVAYEVSNFLGYATKSRNDPVWTHKTIEYIDKLGGGIDIAVGKDVHISYYNSSENAVKYVTKPNIGANNWSKPEPVESQTGITQTSIALDSKEQIHLVFPKYSSENNKMFSRLLHATRTNNDWNKEVVTEEVVTEEGKGLKIGLENSMVVDSMDRIHIAYQDIQFYEFGNRDYVLKYATNNSPGPDLTVSPKSLDFGRVLIGQCSATKEISILNTGTEKLEVWMLKNSSWPKNFSGKLGSDWSEKKVELLPEHSSKITLQYCPSMNSQIPDSGSTGFRSSDLDTPYFQIDMSGSPVTLWPIWRHFYWYNRFPSPEELSPFYVPYLYSPSKQFNLAPR